MPLLRNKGNQHILPPKLTHTQIIGTVSFVYGRWGAKTATQALALLNKGRLLNLGFLLSNILLTTLWASLPADAFFYFCDVYPQVRSTSLVSNQSRIDRRLIHSYITLTTRSNKAKTPASARSSPRPPATRSCTDAPTASTW